MPTSTVRRAIILSAFFLPTFNSELIAGSSESQLSVSATVESGCALTGGAMSFGTYVSGQTSDLDVAGTINYTNCGPGSLSLELDNGLQPADGNRQMVSGESRLRYEIYRNTNRTAAWGDGDDDHDIQLFSTQGGTVSVYGRIPGNQSVAAGSYTDTVTITLNF